MLIVQISHICTDILLLHVCIQKYAHVRYCFSPAYIRVYAMCANKCANILFALLELKFVIMYFFTGK